MKYIICGEWGKPCANDVPSECLLLTLPHPCLGPIASDPSKWWEPHTLPMSLKEMAKSSSGPSVDIDSACRKSSPSLLRLLLYIDRSYWGWLNLSPCSAVCNNPTSNSSADSKYSELLVCWSSSIRKPIPLKSKYSLSDHPSQTKSLELCLMLQ